VLEGQVALVTGASRGIGRALATRLHQEGMRLALTARSRDQLEELAADLGGAILTFAGDVTDPAHVRHVVAETESALGRIDLLVNNAGVVEPEERPLWESDLEGWWGAVTTNVRGPMLFAGAVVPGMLARGAGRIISLNSMRSVRSMPTQTAYGVSKAALAQLTESLQAGLAGTPVRAFSYSPGRVRTAMTQTLGLTALPPSAWTSMEQALDGLVAIASGDLDELAGRFLHANDDFPRLRAQAQDVVANAGRVLTYADAYADDPVRLRTVGR
jgi:3-oxoacyl-[acyl-carrier protein] reductase